MNSFKHTLRFALAILIIAAGIGGVYYFLNHPYVSATVYGLLY
jgi:hypothetical protein